MSGLVARSRMHGGYAIVAFIFFGNLQKYSRRSQEIKLMWPNRAGVLN